MLRSPRKEIFVWLLLIAICAPLFRLVAAQEPRARNPDEKTGNWPIETTSPIRTASGTTVLANEPVMRIALSTGTGAATISTTANLLSVPEFGGAAQRLETTRVRVESRSSSGVRPVTDRSYEIELAVNSSRDEADRLAQSIRETTAEEPQLVNEPTGKWRVFLSKQTKGEADETAAKLDDAGYEVLGIRETTGVATANPSIARSATVSGSPAVSPNRVKLTARPAAPSRELIAYARGPVPTFRSSAPMIFASSDEKNAPVRFNDKPYRGRIEVFPN